MKKTVSLIFVLILIFAASAYAVIWTSSQAPRSNTAVSDITVIYSIPNFDTSGEIRLPSNTTALGMLQEINRKNSNLKLETKAYGSMGELVESMAGKKNGANNAYWTYYVNGEMATVGAGTYQLHNNDKIEWKFSSLEQ